MTLSAESFVSLFANERDKLVKVFENRLVQFELRIQHLLENHPKCDCLKQENRVLEIASNLETEFGKFSQQMQCNNVMQKLLLNKLEILNESELLKQSRINSHDLSSLKVETGVGDIDPNQVEVQNMDLKDTIKNRVSGDGVRSASNPSVQGEDQQNSFEFVHIPPLVPVIPPYQNEEILFDRQMMHENNDKNLRFAKEKGFNDTDDAQTLLSVISSRNEADNTNGPLYFCNDTSLSIDKPFEVNVKNPAICLQDIKEETVDTTEEMWPMETPGCSKTPFPRYSYNNLSLSSDTTQFKSEVNEQDNGVVVEIQRETGDQSAYVFDKTPRYNQLTNTTDQTQSDIHYRCEKCDCLFADEEVFKKHMKVKHPDRSVMKRYKCDFCSYSSDKRNHLQLHLRVHTKEKPFQCTVCSKKFARKSHLTRHIRIHTNERPYECNKCGKRFNELSNMQTHLRTVHDKRKSFVCNICSFSFGQLETLNRHMPSHTGVHNYKCQYCEKIYTQASSLQTHQHIHTGEKPHKCKECSAAFTRSGQLSDHRITQHTKQFPYRCSVCEKGFLQITHKKKHEESCQ